MSDQILRWGLLSTARINQALIPPLRASKRNQLLAVASRSQVQADAYARQWKIPRALGSYDALLADPEIDVIYNSLPNHLHAPWTIKALHAGKHVLCEKPLALNTSEVDAMLAAAKDTGLVLAEAFMYRHHPQTLKVKEIIDSGVLGELRFLRGAFTYTLTRTGNYRLNKEMGGGSLWDIGCYPISYMRMLIGAEPLQVFGWQISDPGGSDLSFSGGMRFPGGILASFESSFQSALRTDIEIVASLGVLSIPNPYKPGQQEAFFLKQGHKTETIKIAGPELYSGEVSDMADAVLLAKAPRVTLVDSRANTRTIQALLESAKSGAPVTL